ncbi:uncharacterized protein Dvir_GJ15213 [Drosophila virilis]|uniref:Uncharacterized protein n=1 Tax=Drosophila virilis TaxID=7244 RepID=B4MD27_DROVI|nr:uncharacterized protein Dvir_GJ15213 [Drosophila virilis]
MQESKSSRSGTVDIINGNSSVSKLRPLARLDRLLRRWLPGYNYLRGAGGGIIGSSGGRQSPGTGAVTPPLNVVEQQRSGRQTPLTVDPPLTVRRRRDGEVLLDTGIAKSEFCLKLEKLLRAKLIVKD